MSSTKRASSQDGVSPPPVKRKQPSTTTRTCQNCAYYVPKFGFSHIAEKAVSNFFKPASQKEPDKVSWRIVNNSLLIGKYHVPLEVVKLESNDDKRKIAAFDFVHEPSVGRGHD